MKKLIPVSFFAFFGIFSLIAQEKVSLAIEDSRDIETPFVIERYQANPQGKIKVDTVSEKKVRITGLAQGQCELRIIGGGISKNYSITVVSNLKKTLKKLKNDLQEISELDISINEDVIIIRGKLSKYEKWKLLKEVLSAYDAKTIRSFVRFSPSAETVIGLKKTFETMGYSFSESSDTEPGSLYIKISPEAFFVSGKVFSENEKAEIVSVLKSQPWLDLNSTVAQDGKVKGFVNIGVVRTQIAVDIAFVAISKKESDDLGSKGILAGNFNFGILYDIISGRAVNKVAQFGGDINRTLAFLADSGVSRVYKAGTVTFTNNSSDGGFIKVGGTHYVPVSGVSGGDVREINYGFIVTVKGSIINRKQMDLNLNLEYSHMATDLKKEDNSLRTSRIIDIDKTAIIGGFREVTQNISKNGLPILRNTPVLQWFVGSEEQGIQKADLLVIVCPRVYKDVKGVEIDIPLTQQLAPTVKDAKMTNKEYKESQKKYSGWLYWLNWFVW